MRRRPAWWDWELELTLHVLKRMPDRGFTEIDLRRIINHRLPPVSMNGQYLEVTFQLGGKCRALAAYLYLPRRTRDRSARTRRVPPGLVVDLAPDGRPIGIEITAPSRVTVAGLNRVLRALGCATLTRTDLAPLRAA